MDLATKYPEFDCILQYLLKEKLKGEVLKGFVHPDPEQLNETLTSVIRNTKEEAMDIVEKALLADPQGT